MAGTATEAQLALGQLLLDAGDGPGAWDAFAAAGRAHDARALNMLGRMCEHGWNGLAPDTGLAVSFYRRAATAGSGWALFNLGDLYLRGVPGLEQDDQAAFACYGQAANRGVTKALNMLGLCHEAGRGTPFDAGQAVAFFKAGAESGDCWARFNMGRLALEAGMLAQAADWFEASIATGFPDYWLALARALADHDDDRLRALARRAVSAGQTVTGTGVRTVPPNNDDLGKI